MNRRHFVGLGAALLALGLSATARAAWQKDADLHLWGVYEQAFQSSREYADPVWDATVTVEFTAPSGATRAVEAFWDGERTWRARFSPTETGTWRWRTRCSDEGNAGLHGQEGGFRCGPYRGDNPLYRHGPLRVSADRTHLVHQDGTPLFWLADTAWNGPLRAKPADWHRYLDTRRRQQFSAIQFVTTQWRGGRETLPELPFVKGERLSIRPSAFQRLDPQVSAINERGLLAVPVLLWALIPTDPGLELPEADAVRLARYTVARWGAHQVVWFLGGDGKYEGENAERWRRIGRAVFGDRRDRLVTQHPGGGSWVGEEFRKEPWFNFIGYQSGHGGSDAALRWLVAGPPAQNWRREPLLPVINLEPNYEAHPGIGGGRLFQPYEVRRAAYWSLLVAPTAGVTYGHNAVWVWNGERGPAEGHPRLGPVDPWTTGLETDGIHAMTHLREYFASGPWPSLRPAPELLAEQPGARDPARFVAAARTGDGAWAVVYLPTGGEVKFDLTSLKRPVTARWIDPRTGRRIAGGRLQAAAVTLKAPDGEDWVLDLRRDQG